jgi:hypothetical protein
LAVGPFGPWSGRPGPVDPSAKLVEPSLLSGIRGEIAQLYRAFYPGLKPTELDAMELWVRGVLRGLDVEPERLQGPPVAPPLPVSDEPLQSGPRLRAVRT